MQIYLNGEAQQTTHTTLLQLIQALDLEGKRFAVEQNEKNYCQKQTCRNPYLRSRPH